MVVYDLSHLTQPEHQMVAGPVQDDEALFMYSVIRGRRLRCVLEIGGLQGYSATNFLRAVEVSGGTVFTVDVNPVASQAANHVVLTKDARDLTPEDLRGQVLDFVFFDCHDYDVQMAVFERLHDRGCLTDDTVIALHDTNTHPARFMDWAYQTPQGWVHQAAERRMVGAFRAMGYDVFLLHTRPEAHTPDFPFRHGLALCTKVQALAV